MTRIPLYKALQVFNVLNEITVICVLTSLHALQQMVAIASIVGYVYFGINNYIRCIDGNSYIVC